MTHGTRSVRNVAASSVVVLAFAVDETDIGTPEEPEAS